MAYDLLKYTIVQTGPVSWAVKYTDGPLLGKFSTRDQATDYAVRTAQGNSSSALLNISALMQSSGSQGTSASIMSAEIQANEARLKYRQFIESNPKASETDTQPYLQNITDADNTFNALLARQESTRMSSTATSTYTVMSLENELENARIARDDAINEAMAVQNQGGSSSEIEAANQSALEAERFYENVSAELYKSRQVSSITPSKTDPSGLLTNQFSTYDGSVLKATGGQAAGNSSAVLNPNGGSTANTNSLRDAARLAGITDPRSGNYSLTSPSNSTNSNNNSQSGNTSSGARTEQRVRLSPKPALRNSLLTGILAPLKETGGMIFPYTPTITYQSQVNYNVLEAVQSNNDYQIYKNTPSINLSITGTFTSQNDKEAQYTLACIHFLRTLSKSHFGDSDDNKGLPPPQVLLDGYGTYMFNGLSVVITSFNVDLTNNVDYVDVTLGGETTSVPVLCNISVTCIVQVTPKKSREFNWNEFASGTLMKKKGWL